jgi:hypothetical protein
MMTSHEDGRRLLLRQQRCGQDPYGNIADSPSEVRGPLPSPTIGTTVEVSPLLRALVERRGEGCADDPVRVSLPFRLQPCLVDSIWVRRLLELDALRQASRTIAGC